MSPRIPSPHTFESLSPLKTHSSVKTYSVFLLIYTLLLTPRPPFRTVSNLSRTRFYPPSFFVPYPSTISPNTPPLTDLDHIGSDLLEPKEDLTTPGTTKTLFLHFRRPTAKSFKGGHHSTPHLIFRPSVVNPPRTLTGSLTNSPLPPLPPLSWVSTTLRLGRREPPTNPHPVQVLPDLTDGRTTNRTTSLHCRNSFRTLDLLHN